MHIGLVPLRDWATEFTAGTPQARHPMNPRLRATARDRLRHLAGAIRDARPTLCALGRREAARLWCPLRRAPPGCVRRGGRSSRGRGLRRSRRGSRPSHRGKPPGRSEPSAAAAVDIACASTSRRARRGHLGVPKWPPRRGCRSWLPAAGAGSCTCGAEAKPMQPEACCGGRVAAPRPDLGHRGAARALLAPKGDR